MPSNSTLKYLVLLALNLNVIYFINQLILNSNYQKFFKFFKINFSQNEGFKGLIGQNPFFVIDQNEKL